MLILFCRARGVSNSTALQEEGEEREEGRRADQAEEGGTHVESDSSLVEVSSAPHEDPTTEALTAARFALQPSSSSMAHPRQVTPLQAARWQSGAYSGYQRGQDWPHQRGKEVVWSQETPFPFPHWESYCERKNQSILIQTDQRNLENPPQMSFAEQSRPSVIKSVRKKITSGQN